MQQQTYQLPDLPPSVDLETREIMRALNQASRALAQFNGESKTIPNQDILISTLFLQEALASSKIENIVTTEDEMFQADLFPDRSSNAAAKEVAHYREALLHGYQKMRESQNIISNNLLIDLFQILKQQKAEFRTGARTILRNQQTRDVVYVPPQTPDEIVNLMAKLEAFINQDDVFDIDPLIKMALIHHQFESIHPFSDGNGRIGRILNVLYLTRTGLLDAPVLYMSREIVRRKSEYYRLLQAVREQDGWHEWIVFMLECIGMAAENGIVLVREIRLLMQDFKERMKRDLPLIYTQDLLNNLFRHPYTRIKFIQRDLKVTRQTASSRLKQLAEYGFVSENTGGRNKYYINDRLVRLFIEISKDD